MRQTKHTIEERQKVCIHGQGWGWETGVHTVIFGWSMIGRFDFDEEDEWVNGTYEWMPDC